MSALLPHSPQAPMEASFNSLPPELKAHIIHFVAKQESLDQLEMGYYSEDDESDAGDDEDDGRDRSSVESELVDGTEDEQGVIPTTEWADKPSRNSLRNVSLVCTELAEMAYPYLWKKVDFGLEDGERSQRSTESVLSFLDNILPRHARHIRSIQFDQFHEADLSIPAARVAELLPRLASPDTPLPAERAVELGTVAEEQPWRLRSYVFAAIVNALPRLEVIYFDVAPYLSRDVREDVDGTLTGLDERVANPLLRAIEAKGDQITTLVLQTGTIALDGSQLGAFLSSCPNLVKLQIDLALRSEGTVNHDLVDALAALDRLESLSIADADWVNGYFARAAWCAPLRILALARCETLWVEDLRTLAEKFAATLDTLDLDDTPAADVQSDDEGTRPAEDRRHAQGRDWGRAWRLPRLGYLVVGCDQEPTFLDFFRECPVRLLEIGYCPLIRANDFEAFIALGADREGDRRLREVRIQGDANLTDGQREAIEVLCFAKGIQCRVEVGSDDEYTDSDVEGEVEEIEEWTDEDDEDGWEMDDRDEDEGDEGDWVSDGEQF